MTLVAGPKCRFQQRSQRSSMTLISIGKLLLQGSGDNLHFAFRLIHCDAWLQPANAREEWKRAIGKRIALLDGKDLLSHHRWHPEVRTKNGVHPFETFGTDADDCERNVV